MAECLGCKQVKMNLVKLDWESQNVITGLMTRTGTLKVKIDLLKERLRVAKATIHACEVWERARCEVGGDELTNADKANAYTGMKDALTKWHDLTKEADDGTT